MRNFRTLIVDDDEPWRKLLPQLVERGLADAKVKLVIKAEGHFDDALGTLQEGAWDLLITDLQLPPLQGELLGMHLVAAARDRNIPCIVISGKTGQGIIAESPSRIIADCLNLYRARTYFDKAEVQLLPDRVREIFEERSIGTQNHYPSPESIATRDVLFLCYARADTDWLNKLLKQLRGSDLAASANIRTWCDRDIEAGAKWDAEIKAALSRACAAVLLVTPDFLSSEYIRNQELPEILELSRNRLASVSWVSVEPSLVDQRKEIFELKCLNEPERPLSDESGRGLKSALVEVGRNICNMCQAANAGRVV